MNFPQSFASDPIMNALAKEEEADRDDKEGEEEDGGGGGGDAKANRGKHTFFSNKKFR